jgi:hypothetical protein
VLDGGNLDPTLFQARGQPGIADAERIGPEVDRRHQIDAAKHDAGVGLRRAQDERHLDAGVETDAGSLDN